MSERTVRIPTEALAQRLNRIEERVRALSLRSWPGSVRTSREPLVDVPSPAPTGWVPLASITVDPGRWVVFAETTLSVGVISAGAYNLQAVLWASDPLSGGYLSYPVGGIDWTVTGSHPENFHFSHRVAYQTVLSTSSGVSMPMNLSGDFASEEPVTITLGAASFFSNNFIAYDSNLMLLPV